MSNYSLSKIEGARFPLYLIETGNQYCPVSESDIHEILETLTSRYSSGWAVVRVASTSDLRPFLPTAVHVDPIIWSPDLVDYYGYMIYL